MKKLLFIAFLISAATLNAQEYKSFTIENISEEAVWPAVIQAFKDVKLPRPSVNKYTGRGQTNYYYYKALMIKNRLRFEVEYSEGALTVGILGRQYESEQGWADNLLPMSKKKAKKLLDPLQKRIRELTKDKPYQETAVAVSHTLQSTPQSQLTTKSPPINKTGIYDDFALLRTEDPDMDLLALHQNGNIMGFDLREDYKTVKSLVFKENKDSYGLIMEFDENGLPKWIVTDNLVIKIHSAATGESKLLVKDTDGNLIEKKTVNLNIAPIQKSEEIPFERDNKHGPHPGSGFQYTEPNLSGGVANAATALSAVLSAVAAPNLGKAALAVASETGLSAGISKLDPDNRFLLNELNTTVGLIGLEGTLASATTTLASSAPVLVPLLPYIAASAVIVAGLKMSYDAAMRIKERHWPTPKLEIIGHRNDLVVGIFGEQSIQPLIFHIETNFDIQKNEITVYGNDGLEIKKHDLAQNDFISKDNLEEEDRIYYEVYAKESSVSEHYISAYATVEGEDVSDKKDIKVTEPTKYFYLQNCSDCSGAPASKQLCEEKLNQCLNSLKKDENNIYFVLDADDNIIDCNKTLNDARRDYVRSSTSANRGFKSFVKEAPCSFSCEGLTDRETIISLAHEAMDKIQAINDKIEALQKVVNENNYLKIGMEIKKLEDRIKPIRNEYGEKINAIAEKGTIRFETIHKDPARYYEPSGTKVVGAHWSRPFLTILLKMETTAKPYRETLYKDTPSPITLEYKDASTVTCLYLGKDNEELMKGTFFARNSSGLDFSTFEKIEKIHTIKSNPISVRVDK